MINKELLLNLATEIREIEVPQDMTWEERVGFMVAKNNIANFITDKYANL
jgi:hypothetical protein